MNDIDSLPQTTARPAVRPTPALARYLYTGFALVLVGFMLWGFQHFYFHGRAYPGRPLTPPIRTLVILHGSAMAAWMLLLVVQPFLIATNNRRLHMTLGKLGAAIAAAIVVLGLMLAIQATRVNPPENKISGLVTKQFMAVPFISILFFGVCVAGAILWRRRAAWHRAFILTGTMLALSAALARIDSLNAVYANTVFDRVFGVFFWSVVIALGFLLVKSVVTRSFDRAYALGCVAVAAASAFIMWIAPTNAWDRFASMLLR